MRKNQEQCICSENTASTADNSIEPCQIEVEESESIHIDIQGIHNIHINCSICQKYVCTQCSKPFELFPQKDKSGILCFRCYSRLGRLDDLIIVAGWNTIFLLFLLTIFPYIVILKVYNKSKLKENDMKYSKSVVITLFFIQKLGKLILDVIFNLLMTPLGLINAWYTSSLDQRYMQQVIIQLN